MEFFWTTIPDSPASFTYTLNVADDADGEKTITGEALYRRLGGELSYTIAETTINRQTFHSADYTGVDEVPDWKIDLSELLRVIQIYNFSDGAYHCDATNIKEDGYGLGAGDQTCPAHALDYRHTDPEKIGPDWSINLSELLRLIQIYNNGCYEVDPTGEDGFGLCPSP